MKWQLPYPEVLCSKYDGGGTQYARFSADSLVGAIKWQRSKRNDNVAAGAARSLCTPSLMNASGAGGQIKIGPRCSRFIGVQPNDIGRQRRSLREYVS